MTKAGVGLAGYGLAGEVFHAPLIQAEPRLDLIKVLERSSNRSKQRYPDVDVANNFDSLLRDDRIGLVVIATPNETHFEFAQKALEAGKNVVIDKPFTVNSAEALHLIELAGRKGLLLSVFQNRRWDGDFLTVRKLIESKQLGRLVEFESRFDRFRNAPKPNAWREKSLPGSGILFDLGPHLIDQALNLFGQPVSIRAMVNKQRDHSTVDDAFELDLDYIGLHVKLKAGMLVRAALPRFTLLGTEGSYVKYGLDPQESALKNGLTPTNALWGKEDNESWGSVDTTINGIHYQGKLETVPGNYPAYYQNVAEALLDKKELAVKPEEAYKTIRLIELAFESHLKERNIQIQSL